MRVNEIPDERLRVFISSAQSNEGGFAWSEVRRRIKDYLKECPYLNPFIIEDTASPMQSEQYYQMQLRRADVVVLLVKGEVRKGTATEYALATTLKKPLMIYFLDDGSIKELSVITLKKDVEANDYCTYRSVPDFEDIEKVVRKDVIESVILYFQKMSYHDQYMGNTDTTISLPDEARSTKQSIPTKTAIALFSSCYGHIFDLLGIPQVKRDSAAEPSTLHDLGVAALEWLITGQSNISDRSILDLIDSVSELYSETNWLRKRWDAIRYEIAGDIDGALAAENQALSMARASEMPPWIVANILIDCRNIENELFAKNRMYFSEGDGQKELNELNTIVYLPVLDRYLGEIYGSLAKETLKYKTAKPNTVFMGTNIGSIINDVENYFFTAMLYGSYTHILIARELLAKVLYQYDELTGKDPLLFNCVKLLVLHGDAKKFQKIVEYKWDEVYLSIASNADELWHLTDGVPSTYKDSMKRAVLAKVGMYMTDECFADAEAYMKEAATSVYWGISEDFFNCIYQNIKRLDALAVTKMLTGIIREQNFHLGSTVANILTHLNVGSTPVDAQLELCEVLAANLTYIVSNGGHPQFIAALVLQNRTVFERLASIPNNGLQGTEKILYDVNTGDGDWLTVIDDQIKNVESQFEANKTPGIYCEFSGNPYGMIKAVIRDHYSNKMKEIINNKLIPLCIEILNSQVSDEVKDQCIDCLCDLLVYPNSGDIVITQELVQSIQNIDVSNARSIMGGIKSTLACRVLMLKIITGTVDQDEMLEWCFEFTKKDRSTKIALAECIEQYLRHYVTDPEKVDVMIVSIVFQCFEDDYWPVRKKACNCLAKMLTTRYKERVERKLYEGAIDPNHFVRNHLLIMCKNGEIENVAISDRITDILRNDANFAIRAFAND